MTAASGVVGLVLALAGLLATPLHAQRSGQSFVVTPDSARALVGDSVTLRFRIHLHERDQLLDSVPQVVGDLSPGVRVLSVEKLSRTGNRAYDGAARVAFYRTGRRAVPIFGLQFMRVVEGVSRATLASDSAFVQITPILPAGNPPLQDIKELERRSFPAWVWLTAALTVLVSAAGVMLWRRRRRRGAEVVAAPEPLPEPVAPSPYEIALEQLEGLERERWPARGSVARHYEAGAQVLRQYLEHAHGVGALERTTPELLWSLPPHLSRGGLRDRCHALLDEADLVKFAEVRPGEAEAAEFLARARQLLISWHQAGVAEEAVHALR
ncbi:MAG TPA: hypothetical protein VFO71_05140 [Gemmatimonadales bacterium]|nr:hypothetical protein [Gemmatimonadales bacterium]